MKEKFDFFGTFDADINFHSFKGVLTVEQAEGEIPSAYSTVTEPEILTQKKP